MSQNKKNILFVCLGNICRSPLAEGIFIDLINERGIQDKFNVDSCGTGTWHVGNGAHPESVQIAKTHGIDISSQRSRVLADEDYFKFQYIVAMDESNLRDIEEKKITVKGHKEPRCFCIREYDPEKKSPQDISVPDPYYEGGFEGVFQMIKRSLESLLDSGELG